MGFQTPSKSGDSFEALLQRAFGHHRQQQYRLSIPLLEQARILRPRDYVVNLLLGIDTLRSGNPASALRFLKAALEGRSGDVDALGYLAEAHAVLQQFDQAAQALRRAATQSGASSQARLALIQFYLRRFRAVAEELRQSNAGLSYAYRLHAMSLQANQTPQKRELLLRVQSLAPEFPGLESALGHAALCLGEFEAAAKSFDKARGMSADDLELKLGEAILAVHANELARAEAILFEVRRRSAHRFRVALREWPGTVPMTASFKRRLAGMGAVEKMDAASTSLVELFQQQRWEAVIDRLSQDAKTVEECFWLGSALSRLERYGEAP